MIWKPLVWSSRTVNFLGIWPRGGALQQNEQKPENGSRAPPSGPILMTYTFKDGKFFTDSEYVYIMTYWRPTEVNLGSNRRKGSNRADKSKYIQLTYVSTLNFLKNLDSIFSRSIRVNRGQTWVKGSPAGEFWIWHLWFLGETAVQMKDTIVLLLGYFYQKMPYKHPCKVFMGLAWKGWFLEHFWKSDFWPIFDIFLKMTLKFIPL